jgi:hypothetical protein
MFFVNNAPNGRRERTSASVDFCFEPAPGFVSGALFLFSLLGRCFQQAVFSGAILESSIIATDFADTASRPSAALVSSTPAFQPHFCGNLVGLEIKSASPGFTKSPDFLCQTETTPVEIDSPTAGILTSMLISGLQYAQSQGVVEPNVEFTLWFGGRALLF